MERGEAYHTIYCRELRLNGMPATGNSAGDACTLINPVDAGGGGGEGDQLLMASVAFRFKGCGFF